jgi:hypothetical protein
MLIEISEPHNTDFEKHGMETSVTGCQQTMKKMRCITSDLSKKGARQILGRFSADPNGRTFK